METNLKDLAVYIKQLADGAEPVNTHEEKNSADKAQIVAIPKTHDIYDMKDFLPKDPVRIVSSLSLYDVNSFIAYINEYKGPATHIFGQITKEPFYFKGIIDYHSKETPAWCDHSVMLVLQYSKEFANWHDINGKMLKQSEFAEFLKDHRMDIIEPVSSSIVELVMKLEVASHSYCSSKLPINNGTYLKYEEVSETAINGTVITVPDCITLNVPMFFGMALICIKAEFKIRIQDKVPMFGIRLLEIQNMELTALKAISELITKETGKKVLL